MTTPKIENKMSIGNLLNFLARGGGNDCSFDIGRIKAVANGR